MGISLRRASIADAETIHKLQVESFLPLLRKYQDFETNPANDSVERIIARLKQPQTSFFIVVLDVVPIGAIRVIIDDRVKSARISPMFIVPRHQGKGYGQEAIELVEGAVQAEHWELETILQEKGNCYFYEKNGYRRTGIPRAVNSKMTIVSYEKSTEGGRTNERP